MVNNLERILGGVVVIGGTSLFGSLSYQYIKLCLENNISFGPCVKVDPVTNFVVGTDYIPLAWHLGIGYGILAVSSLIVGYLNMSSRDTGKIKKVG